MYKFHVSEWISSNSQKNNQKKSERTNAPSAVLADNLKITYINSPASDNMPLSSVSVQ